MIVLVLAAGYATRLYPLTLDTPKPLLKVGERLLIEHILDRIASLSGVKRCFVITNDKFFEKFSKWAAAFKFSVPLQVINDKTTTNENRLGAVRDIEFAMRQERINDDLLVIGGDNLFKFDLKAFVDFAASHRPASSLAVFDIKDKAKASIYGVVKTDPQDKVIGFQEKPPRPDTSLISTCVYYFPREALGLILEYLASGIGQDATGNYIKWLSENHAVYAFSFKERWYDIGDIESYKKADKDYHKD